MVYNETPMKGTVMLKKLNTPTTRKLAAIVATTVAVQVAAALIVKKMESSETN
jgi:hypothetical protein